MLYWNANFAQIWIFWLSDREAREWQIIMDDITDISCFLRSSWAESMAYEVLEIKLVFCTDNGDWQSKCPVTPDNTPVYLTLPINNSMGPVGSYYHVFLTFNLKWHFTGSFMAVVNDVKVRPRTTEGVRELSPAKEEKGGVSMFWMRIKGKVSGG